MVLLGCCSLPGNRYGDLNQDHVVSGRCCCCRARLAS